MNHIPNSNVTSWIHVGCNQVRVGSPVKWNSRGWANVLIMFPRGGYLPCRHFGVPTWWSARLADRGFYGGVRHGSVAPYKWPKIHGFHWGEIYLNKGPHNWWWGPPCMTCSGWRSWMLKNPWQFIPRLVYGLCTKFWSAICIRYYYAR